MNTYCYDTKERQAAKAIGVSYETCKRWRLSGKIPPHTYTKSGYKVLRYCLPLLTDWQIDPTDLEAQARAREALQATRPSNLPRKRGPKTAA
jgi:hypothetical protein